MGQFGMQGAEQGAAEHGRAPESTILRVAFRTTARIPLHRHAQRIANRIDRHIHMVAPPLIEPVLILPVGVARGGLSPGLLQGPG
jgi:hypothetical protein